MLRRTKIVATIGPASQAPEILKELLSAGVNVLRFNFSHSTTEVQQTITTARQIARKLKRPLAIMADLQGPKIRIGRFEHKRIILKNGQSFTLNCKDKKPGDESWVHVGYPNLASELQMGDHLLLDDGLIELLVTDLAPPLIYCQVLEGGTLSDHKGINRKGGGLAARTLTSKDKKDMAMAVSCDVDYITLSFVKDAADIKAAKKLLAKLGAEHLPIIAKIERTEAIEHLGEIIAHTDAVMVARGDLGVEVGAAEVPALQKHIIEKARQLNKVVITATQMMESMITQPQPTRAEVSDVANAILDGTDAVMLSAETASGMHPVKVIKMVDNICLSAEKHASLFYKFNQDACHYQRPNQAISMAAMHVANHFPIKAIIALTESGATAIWMSRVYSTVPIFAITDNESTVNRLSMINNVFPFYFDYRQIKKEEIHVEIVSFLQKKNLITKNCYLLLTKGSLLGQAGGTNCVEIIHS